MLDHLMQTEGYRDQVYDDATGGIVGSYAEVSGYPTIGVGHYITADQRDRFAPYLRGGPRMSQSEVTALFREDVSRFENEIRPRITQPFTQSMWDSLISLAYNTGSNSSSVKSAVSAINNLDYAAAQRAIASGPTTSKGRTVAGLVKRRAEEAAWFMRDGLPGGYWKLGLAALATALIISGAIYYRRLR